MYMAVSDYTENCYKLWLGKVTLAREVTGSLKPHKASPLPAQPCMLLHKFERKKDTTTHPGNKHRTTRRLSHSLLLITLYKHAHTFTYSL